MLTLLSRAVTVKAAAVCFLVGAIAGFPVGLSGERLTGGPPKPALDLLGRPSPELKELFAPVGQPDHMYEVYESRSPLERIASALRALDDDARPGSWNVQRLGAGDAFGAEGSYNRIRLALLVGGRRLDVARGAIRDTDGAVAAFTLISPYPDPELRELKPGTMTIVFHVPR